MKPARDANNVRYFLSPSCRNFDGFGCIFTFFRPFLRTDDLKDISSAREGWEVTEGCNAITEDRRRASTNISTSSAVGSKIIPRNSSTDSSLLFGMLSFFSGGILVVLSADFRVIGPRTGVGWRFSEGLWGADLDLSLAFNGAFIIWTGSLSSA